MLDQRRLDFPTANAKYFSERGVVRFSGEDGVKKVICEISEEALSDYFNGNNQDPIKIFKENQEAIEHEARRKYINEQLDRQEVVLIKSEDL